MTNDANEQEAIDKLLQEALTKLDTLGRHDVGAHVDLALHYLRGTHGDFRTHDTDTVS
jgi:hypothetical protein